MHVTLVRSASVFPVAEMALDETGLNRLLDWVREYRPDCVPSDLPPGAAERALALFPHAGEEDGRRLSDNELLTELAGRSCYHSYGLKAGRRSNAGYVERMLFPSDSMPHASVGYHAKMAFFVAGISRRVSHELIRHYVGSDRSEEGSPSQESTRYTLHPGHFVVPPRLMDGNGDSVLAFRDAMQSAYDAYLRYIEGEVRAFQAARGKEPQGLDRKRIYEAAAGLLPMQATTSLMWTTNPVALGKLFRERTNAAADLEFQALACTWQAICVAKWPNLFQR